MTLTLADLDRWDPNAIHSVFKAAIDRANGVRSTATQIGDVVAATPWVGDSHDAALQAAGRVNADLISHAEECEAVGRAARQAEAEVRDIQRDWHNIQRMADKWGIDINTETGELSYISSADPDDRAEMERRVNIIENEIKVLMARATDSDADLAAAIRVAAGLDSIESLNEELKDDPPAPMSEEQGNADAQELWANGHLSPEAQARLQTATALTPEQQAALERGDLDLPQDQLAYLNALSRSLDGKSSEEIRAFARAQGGDKLVDAMRLATNPHVSTTGGVRNDLLRGGLANAPSALRDVINDPTLRVNQSQWEFLVAKGDAGFDPRVLFTHWDGMKDMAAILGQGNPALMRGSALDTGLLGKSGEALKWMNTGVWSGDAKSFADDMTTDVQSMLAASGRDPVAVHDLVVSPPVSGTPDPADNGLGRQVPAFPAYNTEFLHNALTHQWTDGGTAAATMLAGIPQTANMIDPADPTQQAIAVRSGQTVAAVDQYIATHDELLDIPGTDKLSLGQLSPDLTRALANANAPYIDDMIMSNKLDNTAGFAPLDDIIHDPEMTHTRNLFGVLGTDEWAARTLNTHAYADINAFQDQFAHSVTNGTVDLEFSDLKSSGALRGVVDVGANIAANDAIDAQNAAAETAYHNKQMWYSAAKNLPYFGDIVDKIGKVPGAEDVLKDVLIGDAPVPIDPDQLHQVNEDLIKHAVVNKLLQLGAGDTSLLTNEGVVDGAGQLIPFNAPGVTDKQLTDAVDAYLSSLGVQMNTAWDGYGKYYQGVVEGQGK